MLDIGDTAPDFTLLDVHGREKSLRDFIANKAVLITLFKVDCPVCGFTFPFLQRLAKSDNIEVIGISQDDIGATERFRKKAGVTFPTLLDASNRGYPVSTAFGITSVPSLFLVEPGGEISLAGSGFNKRDMEALGRLAGVPPFEPGEKVPEFRGG